MIPKSNVKIISDGTPKGTKVLIGGVKLEFIRKVEIDIRPLELNTATITIMNPCLDLLIKKGLSVITEEDPQPYPPVEGDND